MKTSTIDYQIKITIHIIRYTLPPPRHENLGTYAYSLCKYVISTVASKSIFHYTVVQIVLLPPHLLHILDNQYPVPTHNFTWCNRTTKSAYPLAVTIIRFQFGFYDSIAAARRHFIRKVSKSRKIQKISRMFRWR